MALSVGGLKHNHNYYTTTNAAEPYSYIPLLQFSPSIFILGSSIRSLPSSLRLYAGAGCVRVRADYAETLPGRQPANYILAKNIITTEPRRRSPISTVQERNLFTENLYVFLRLRGSPRSHFAPVF